MKKGQKFICEDYHQIQIPKIYSVKIKKNYYKFDICVKEYFNLQGDIEIKWELVAGRKLSKLTDEEYEELNNYIINMEWLK